MIDSKVEKYIFPFGASAKQVIQGLYHHKRHISLICDSGKHIIGIVTLGDIKQAINRGLDPEEAIGQIMNTRFTWAEEGAAEADLQKMSVVPGGASRSIPILNNKREVVGMFFNTDQPELQHKTVFVTGAAGYVGSLLCRKLLARGYRVIAFDSLHFGKASIQDLISNSNFKLMVGDISNINNLIKEIKEADYVIHLAAVVGDPAASVDPIYTLESNYFSTQVLIELSKYFQISRFIFASSCSVYGASDPILTENSPLSPVSLYARSKIASEKELLKMSGAYFHPTILRFGTLYGFSYRMRFDLVVNAMAAHAFFKNEILVTGRDQWRPLLHVADAAQACICMLEEPDERVSGQIFNVGSNDQNFQISQIAETIQRHLPRAVIKENNEIKDERNYRVDFSKINTLTGFRTSYTLESGIKEILVEMEQGKFQDFDSVLFSNYEYAKSNYINNTPGIKE